LQVNQSKLEIELSDDGWLELKMGESENLDGLSDPSFPSHPLLNLINFKLKQIYLYFSEHSSEVVLIWASF
jgi:hypothetical protein